MAYNYYALQSIPLYKQYLKCMYVVAKNIFTQASEFFKTASEAL